MREALPILEPLERAISPFREQPSAYTKSGKSRPAQTSNPSHHSPTPTAYPIDWSKVTGYDAQVYRDVANTLAGLIAANGASESAAVDSGETDKAGRLTFAGVEDGLYLVVSDSVKVEGAAGAAAVGGTADEDSYWQCASANMLVAMPQDGVSNGSRELAIEPKTECSTQLKPTLERTVRKVWNDRTTPTASVPNPSP